MVLEVENQGSFDAKDRIGIKIRTLSVKIMGGYTRVPVGAYDEVKVRWPEIVAARQVEKAPDWAVFWDRVIAGARRAEPVAAVVIGMKNAPQVHFGLDFRLLNIIEAVLIRHPDIKGAPATGLPLVSVTRPETASGIPLPSSDILSPRARSGAEATWNGPSTVD